MKHLDTIYNTAEQHNNASISMSDTQLPFISYDNGQFIHGHVMQVTIRGDDGTYSRSFVNAIHREFVK